MAYNPQNPNGSATSANSAPVVIASDQAAVSVSGPLTDTQLRATAVPVSGTFWQTTQPVSIAASVAVTGPLTDTQLRATAVPISGTVTANAGTGTQNVSVQNTSLAVTGTFFQTTQPVSATSKFSIGSNVVMTVTSLQSLASSATVGWQSDRVSNLSTLARDYEIFVKLTTANTAPGSDRSMYVYICPWYTTDGGTTWFAASQGTTTLPTGTQGASTIASPNNLRLLGVLNYTTQNMVVQDVFLLSNCFGDRMPDGFSIIIINFSGAALSTSCVVNYKPINDTLV